MTDPQDKIEIAKQLLKDIENYFTEQSIGRSEIGIIRHALQTVANHHYQALINDPTPETLRTLVIDMWKLDDPHGGINRLLGYLDKLCTQPEQESPLKYW